MNILTGGNLLGWHKFDDIYKFTNNLSNYYHKFITFNLKIEIIKMTTLKTRITEEEILQDKITITIKMEC
jgi:hypothetical protein